MSTLSENLRALLRLHPRSAAEHSMPSGGWVHWLSRARDLGLITSAEHDAWQNVAHATLARMEEQVCVAHCVRKAGL